MIRGFNVMLDNDLAELYDVPTKQLNRQVKRNIKRFPSDFMFQVSKEEVLRCQIGTSNKGGRRYLPYAFTEQGVAMLSSVLNSERSIQVNIVIMRTFAKLKHFLLMHKELKHKIDELEVKVGQHDSQIKSIFDAIKYIMAIEEKPKRKIGFQP